MTFEEIWKISETIPGFLFKEEAEKLWQFASSLRKGETILEIGSFCGRSSVILAEAAKQKKLNLVCVDSFILKDKVINPEGAFRHDVLKSYPFVQLKKIDSGKLVKEWFEDIHYLFIDGDHTKKGISIDLAWTNKLVPGGLVSFHDYNHPHYSDLKMILENFPWPTENLTWSLLTKRRPN